MKKICRNCGELREYYGKGLCKPCYNAYYYKHNRDKILKQKKEYDEWYKNRPELSLKKKIKSGDWVEV